MSVSNPRFRQTWGVGNAGEMRGWSNRRNPLIVRMTTRARPVHASGEAAVDVRLTGS